MYNVCIPPHTAHSANEVNFCRYRKRLRQADASR